MTDTLTSDTPLTISRWKRVLYSFVSLLFTWSAIALILSLAAHNFSYGFVVWIGSSFFVWFYGGALCLLGWLLFIPIAFSVSNYEGNRYWVVLAIGNIIAPCALWLTALYNGLPLNIFTWKKEADYLLLLSLAVSLPTTLLYLLLIRRAEHRIKT